MCIRDRPIECRRSESAHVHCDRPAEVLQRDDILQLLAVEPIRDAVGDVKGQARGLDRADVALISKPAERAHETALIEPVYWRVPTRAVAIAADRRTAVAEH